MICKKCKTTFPTSDLMGEVEICNKCYKKAPKQEQHRDGAEENNKEFVYYVDPICFNSKSKTDLCFKVCKLWEIPIIKLINPQARIMKAVIKQTK